MTTFNLPLITDNKEAFAGKRVLLRLDFNVPLEAGQIRDDYRIKESLATINFLREAGAKLVIISHIGKGKPEDTLHPIATYLEKLYPTVTFLPNLRSEDNIRITNEMVAGDIILLENLRHDKGEEENDSAFAAYLASLGDVYVNDAFSVSHRAHASVVGVVSLLPHFTGIRLAQEVDRLALAFNPEHPFLFILGGAKISTKMPLLKKFLDIADHVFVGGAIVNNFFKVAGNEIGTSIYDKDELDGLASYLSNPRLIIPKDVVVKNPAGSETRKIEEVNAADMIVDVGTDTVKHLEEVIGAAKLIVWNGPLGFYEEGFTEGTRELLDMIAGSRATSIIGGGDTVALINEMHAIGKFSFVSTGGGAMLDFLANETLPGIEALQK
jgi:phosphoglycerate kinase